MSENISDQSDDKSGLHASICRMTNDSSKNGEKIKDGILLNYEYNLIWCTEDHAMRLVAATVSSMDTKRVVFMIGGSTKRERKKHWIINSKMHIRAKMNDARFDDGIFDYNYAGKFKDETEGLFIGKYPNYKLLQYPTTAMHDDYFKIYDPNWRVITDEAELKHHLGEQCALFDSDLMVFVRNDATNQSIVLLSDIHCSAKIGEIQNKFIEEWKPSAASLELDLWTWRYLNDNKDKEHSDLSSSLLNCKKGCAALATACGVSGYKAEGKHMKIAAATGIGALCATGKLCDTVSRRLDRMFKGGNMMSVLESKIPKTIFFSEWFHVTSPATTKIDDLEKELKELEENENIFTASKVLRACTLNTFLCMDSVKDTAEWFKQHRIDDEKITVKVRSDMMFQSLMSLANDDDGSEKHDKIVGVYGLVHVMDIKERFEGNSDGFLLQLNE